MTVPFRTRRFFRRFGVFLLTLAVCACLIWLGWMVWLGRYVVYTREGVVLDFARPSTEISGQSAVAPAPGETVSIYYNEGMEALGGGELAQINGYYIETLDLKGDLTELRRKIAALPDDTPLLIEVKDIFGNFYYPSNIPDSPKAGDADVAAVGSLISDLAKGRRYLIASVPAFRDRYYGLNNTICGVASSEGAYLYMDDEGCYWLDPSSSGTRSYLTGIVSELKSLGFDEVVFTDFCYPDTSYIAFDGDRTEVIAEAASFCMRTCSTEYFAVSFVSSDPSFAMPEGRGRLYLTNVSPAQLKRTVESTTVADKLANLVLLTTLNDTRYDDYSVLRSIQGTS